MKTKLKLNRSRWPLSKYFPGRRLMLGLVILLLAGSVLAEDFGHGDRFPAVKQFLDNLDLKSFPPPSEDAADRWWCDYEPAVQVPEEKMKEFFLAGVRDRITVIRLFALMAETVREQNVALCGSGDSINRVLDQERINLGIGLPMRNLAVYAWVPVYDAADTYTVADLNLVYRTRFIHRFRKEVLPADLKVGTLSPVEFTDYGKLATGYPVGLQFHVSSNKIGFEKMRGVGAKAHGILGIVASIAPFIPDAVHSMYLEQNVLLTKALVRAEVEDFEDTPLYQMHIDAIPYH